MRIDFYQLSHDPAENVAVAIARKVVGEGQRLLVVGQDRQQLDRTSSRLWDAGPASFLAHDHDDAPDPDAQPILLSSRFEPLNQARHVLVLDGVWQDAALTFDRVFFLFGDATIDQARSQWRLIKAMTDVDQHFWRQEEGRWSQIA